MTRLEGFRQRGAHARDAAFGVGDGAVLLAPARRRQDHVGEWRGLRIRVGLLQDDELGALERGAHPGQVGKRLRRVRARDPEDLHLAAAHGVEHFDRGETRFRGNDRYAPERRDFRAMARIGEIAMRREARREPADLAPAHGVRLSGEAERPGARPADLPCGQMQIDQRRVLRGAARRLIEALAIEGQCRSSRMTLTRRGRSGEPARGGDDVVRPHAAGLGRRLRRAIAHHVA